MAPVPEQVYATDQAPVPAIATVVVMPRRPATMERDIPLFLIPHIVMRGVRTHGENLERVIVRKSSCHFYNISTRTRPVKRELKGKQPCTGSSVPARDETCHHETGCDETRGERG